jgi:two-component system NtrC family sensor kinase
VRKNQTAEKRIPKDIDALRSLFAVVEKGKLTWEATFDAIRDPVLIIDKDYRIRRANLAAAGTVRRRVHQMIGERCYEVFAGRSEVCPGCPLKQTLSEERPHTVEIDKLRTDIDFQVNSYPLPTLLDEAAQVVHHYRDVTVGKILQKKLLTSEKMAAIGMLAGGVAHEINNPLGGILAFTQLLRAELPLESPAQEDLREIEDAAKRCKKIVADLLAYARPSVGSDRTPQEINSLLERVLPMLRLSLREASVTIQTDYNPSLPRVLGEATRLQQVFMNLIQNAAEAMPKGGVVKIKTVLNSKDAEVVVEISDTGHGIRKEDLTRIFDPFFTTKGNKGTGLGLSICQSIIQDHQGRIEVESQMGEGSHFRVIFPTERVRA